MEINNRKLKFRVYHWTLRLENKDSDKRLFCVYSVHMDFLEEENTIRRLRPSSEPIGRPFATIVMLFLADIDLFAVNLSL